LVDAFTATTSADKAAVATAVNTIDSLITANVAGASLALTAAVNTAAAGATATAAESADIAALNSVSSLLANNALNVVNADTTPATAAELATGLEAYVNAVVTAAISATSTTVTAAQKATIVSRLISGDIDGSGVVDAADAAIVAAAVTADQAGDGVNGGANGNGAVLGAAAGGIIQTAGAGTAVVAHITDAIATMDVVLNAAAPTAVPAGLTAAVATAQMNSVIASGVKAMYDSVIADFVEIAAAQTSVDALDTKATIIELENDGTTVTMATGATAAASDDNDVFGYVTDLDNSVTIGTAAQAFGANGDDTLIIAGEYTFTTITKAQADNIANETLGDASALEIFVYQNATSGDAVLYVERSAGEGNVEGDTMSTITLTDVTFADLGQTVADGVTVLTSAEAVVA